MKNIFRQNNIHYQFVIYRMDSYHPCILLSWAIDKTVSASETWKAYLIMFPHTIIYTNFLKCNYSWADFNHSSADHRINMVSMLTLNGNLI